MQSRSKHTQIQAQMRYLNTALYFYTLAAILLAYNSKSTNLQSTKIQSLHLSTQSPCNNIREVREYRNGSRFNTQILTNNLDRVMIITNSNAAAGANMTFAYDALGNPTRYGNWYMTWTRGRLLQRMVPRNGAGSSWEFVYDENGIRYRKIETRQNGTQNVTNFYVYGTRILAEESTAYGFIEYFWDAIGPIGMRRNNRNYFFVRDVLNNIVEIIDQAGTSVARYTYDAWGNTTITHNIGNIAHINPFRYRGKYMDRGTGFYYLQTRFYDPRVRRFINADNYMLVPLLAQQQGGLNMYAYALNNPIRYWDPSGQSATALMIGIILTATLIGAATTTTIATVQVIQQDMSGWQAAGHIIGGFFMGVGLGMFVGGLIVALPMAGLAGVGIIGGSMKGAFALGVVGMNLGVISMALGGSLRGVDIWDDIVIIRPKLSARMSSINNILGRGNNLTRSMPMYYNLA